MSQLEILLLEPFYCGSHKVLIDWLNRALKKEFGEEKVCLVTMRGKKWQWRARTSAIYLSQEIPVSHSFRVVFATSVLNMSELIALRGDLRGAKKIVYFHENQLNYPRREHKERDFQYGYNEITSCLVADVVLFNSAYNQKSFLSSIKKHLDLLPDYRPKGLREKIEPKTHVLYFPLSDCKMSKGKNYSEKLVIVWPHRWEHDKNPQDFLNVVLRLSKSNCEFKLHMIGEQFSGQDTFEEARMELGDHVESWGFVPSREAYLEILATSHVAVSTADHEFFGVSMLESAQNGCLPLVPNRLVYPELYPPNCLYKNDDELFNKLVDLSRNVPKIEHIVQNLNINFDLFSDRILVHKYLDLFR